MSGPECITSSGRHLWLKHADVYVCVRCEAEEHSTHRPAPLLVMRALWFCAGWALMDIAVAIVKLLQ